MGWRYGIGAVHHVQCPWSAEQCPVQLGCTFQVLGTPLIPLAVLSGVSDRHAPVEQRNGPIRDVPVWRGLATGQHRVGMGWFDLVWHNSTAKWCKNDVV